MNYRIRASRIFQCTVIVMQLKGKNLGAKNFIEMSKTLIWLKNVWKAEDLKIMPGKENSHWNSVFACQLARVHVPIFWGFLG